LQENHSSEAYVDTIVEFASRTRRILELHPLPEIARVPSEGCPALAQRFNRLFCGPQDYAALGWKPSR
jgi:hypothetical protein